MKQGKEIFFHVGLGKTASTYLQYRVFPKLAGLHYIQRTQYRQALDIIANSQDTKYLVSQECDEQLEYEVDYFSKAHPKAKVIMVLRQQDSWIASQYRRFIKNARPHSFSEFLDIENDQGMWKQKTLYYYPKIEYIEQKFQHKPLVLLHQDLKKDPWHFIQQIIDFMQVDFNKEDISLKPVHKSYNEKQLKAMRWISQYTYQGEHKDPKNRFLKYARHYLYVAPLRYSVLYGSLGVPSFMQSKAPLIDPEELKKVRDFYQADWDKCLAYVQAQVNQVDSTK